jgi:protein-tyrosine-phosphatase
MSDIRSILFVCTGNSCRSVMAEGLMRKTLKEIGKGHIKVQSAGISAIEGYEPTDETIGVMRKAGIDVSGHKSRQVTEALIRSSDLILVMEHKHKEFIESLVPGAKGKTHLLREFNAVGKKQYPECIEIPDPIGRPADYYDLSFQVLKDEVERIASML